MVEPLCKILEWDTNFFGIKIARILIDKLQKEIMAEINEWCQNNNIRCLYFLADSYDELTLRIAEQNRFHFVDTRMTMQYRKGLSVRQQRTPNEFNGIIRSVHKEDISYLKNISRDMFRTTRFYFDSNFPRHQCDNLYSLWIELSCKGYADIVFVADAGNVIHGFISCHLNRKNHTGSIGLAGVYRKSGGRGIGTALVARAISWLEEHGVNEVTVVTQGRNIPAQRLYQSCGFLTRDMALWFHKWFTTKKKPL